MRVHVLACLAAAVLPLLPGCSKPDRDKRALRPAPLPDSGAPRPAYDTIWEASPKELYETGLTLADLNGDGRPDLITASGNDKARQPVAAYLRDAAAAFPTAPSWTSEDVDANMGVAAGDINGDGWIDVAVATLGPIVGGDGGVKVYFNRQGSLERTPSYRTKERFSAFACALGDADGDGDLDLGVSVMGGVEAPRAGAARIYLNDGGAFDGLPDWKAQDPVFGGGILFADVHQDGFLDLVQGSFHISVYAGAPGPDQRVALGSAPAWTSEEGGMTFYLTAGPLGADRRWGIVASRNFTAETAPAKARYEAYLPSSGERAPVWRSDGGGLGGGVKIVDEGGDGIPDLLGVAWGLEKIGRGPFEIYRGAEPYFDTAPSFTSDPTTWSLGQAMDVADLQGRCTATRTHRARVEAPRAVITLPEPVIGSIASVTRNGAPLRRGDYTSVPGAPWLSFKRRLAPGDAVEVTYSVPLRVDVAIAYQDSTNGARVIHDGVHPPAPCRR